MKTSRPRDQLSRYYSLLLESGVILSLLFFIVAFKIKIPEKTHEIRYVEPREVVHMEEITRTEHETLPAAPPRPQVPVEVPNDQIFIEQEINLDAELDFDEPLPLPEPPKQAPADKAEEGEEAEEEIFVVVEQQPELIGGIASLQRKIEYPELARQAGIEGRVYVQFVIDKQGNVTDAHIVRGIGGGCDEEALRVIKQANFQPGLQRGQPVKVRMTMPVVFRLRDSD